MATTAETASAAPTPISRGEERLLGVGDDLRSVAPARRRWSASTDGATAQVKAASREATSHSAWSTGAAGPFRFPGGRHDLWSPMVVEIRYLLVILAVMLLVDLRRGARSACYSSPRTSVAVADTVGATAWCHYLDVADDANLQCSCCGRLRPRSSLHALGSEPAYICRRCGLWVALRLRGDG